MQYRDFRAAECVPTWSGELATTGPVRQVSHAATAVPNRMCW